MNRSASVKAMKPWIVCLENYFRMYHWTMLTGGNVEVDKESFFSTKLKKFSLSSIDEVVGAADNLPAVGGKANYYFSVTSRTCKFTVGFGDTFVDNNGVQVRFIYCMLKSYIC
jgi:hypothetical protein